MVLKILIFMFRSQFLQNNSRVKYLGHIADTKNLTSANKTSDGRREKET